MKWYRFFKSSDAGTTVTVPSAVTTFAVEGNLTVGGTTTVTGIPTLPSATKIGGVTIFVTGAAIGATDVPNRIGDLLISYATGKMYIAGGVSASSDWKIVTSAA